MFYTILLLSNAPYSAIYKLSVPLLSVSYNKYIITLFTSHFSYTLEVFSENA